MRTENMAETLFMPVTCSRCNRTSAMELPVADLDDRLASLANIEICCGYDDHCWQATPHERRLLLQLWQEHKRLSRSSWLRLPALQSRDAALL
jgi:hypothetical protein